ncbi:MAG: glycosyltransferase family 39 protein [Verrucomicrobiia bacterium]
MKNDSESAGSAIPSAANTEVHDVWRLDRGLILLLALATFICLWRPSRTALWLDETWRANACLHSDQGMAHMMPPLYLFLQKGLCWLLGPGETSFRLLSGLAGIGTVASVWLLARLMFGARVALVAGFLVACHPWLVLLAREGKDYALSNAFSPLVCALTVAWLIRPRQTLMFSVGAIGALGILCSWSVCFVAAACLAVMAFGSLVWSRFHKDWPSFAFAGGMVLVATLIDYWWAISSTCFNAFVNDPDEWVWPSPGIKGHFLWLIRQSWELLQTILVHKYTFYAGIYSVILGLALCVGVAVRGQRSGWFLSILMTTVAGAVCAAVIHRWPYSGCRTMMFLVPLVAPIIAAGLCWLCTQLWKEGHFPALFFVALVCGLLPLAWSLNAATRRPSAYDFRSVASKITPLFQSNDLIVLLPLAEHEFNFYTKNLPQGVRVKPAKGYEQIHAWVQQERPRRFWIINTHWLLPQVFLQVETNYNRLAVFTGGNARVELFQTSFR